MNEKYPEALNVARNIQTLREAHGYTQKQLSEILHFHKIDISCLEKAEKLDLFTVADLLKIVCFFDVCPTDIFFSPEEFERRYPNLCNSDITSA